jgi:hypothetical protein
MTLGSSSMQNKTICWLTGQKQSGWQGLSRFGGVGKQVLADRFPGYAPHFFISCTWEESADGICRLHNMFSMSIMRIVNKAVILARARFSFDTHYTDVYVAVLVPDCDNCGG